MIPPSICQPWQTDRSGPMPESTATTPSYTTPWDTIPGGPANEPAGPPGHGRPRARCRVGAPAMCASRGGASRCLSLRARAWAGGSGADAPARCALPGGAVLRLAAHGRGAAARRRPCRSPSGAPADASDGLGGAGAQAGHQPAGAGPSDLSLLIARADDRAAKPSVGRRHQCAAASGVRDGGGPPATGLQEQVANRRKRRGSKARVVSVTEKASERCQVGDRQANTSELPFKCRKYSDDVETGG